MLHKCSKLLTQACAMLCLVDVHVVDAVQQVLFDVVGREAALGHFPDGLVFAPAFDGDAINRGHCPGPVGPVSAVHENRRPAEFDFLHTFCVINSFPVLGYS